MAADVADAAVIATVVVADAVDVVPAEDMVAATTEEGGKKVSSCWFLVEGRRDAALFFLGYSEMRSLVKVLMIHSRSGSLVSSVLFARTVHRSIQGAKRRRLRVVHAVTDWL